MNIVLLAATVALAATADDTRSLVERLSSADASARAEAACELGRSGRAAASAVGPLSSLLADGLVVGPIECGMSPWLRKQLETRPEDWRHFETSPGREAARALARIGRPALGTLMAALTASARWRRRKAAPRRSRA